VCRRRAGAKSYKLSGADDFTAVRFHVTAQLARRTFDQFTLGIGFTTSTAWTPDTVKTSDLLSFAGIGPMWIPALPLPQHLAEQVHAYTSTYGSSSRPSTRPKDREAPLACLHSAGSADRGGT